MTAIKKTDKQVHLTNSKMSVVFDCTRELPVVLYIGKALLNTEDLTSLGLLHTRQEAKCALVEEVALSISPNVGHGFTGHPGIKLRNDSDAWSAGPVLTEIKQTASNTVLFTSIDKTRSIELCHTFSIAENQNVLACSTQVRNLAMNELSVDYCAAPTIQVPDTYQKLLSFEGRWSMEFQQTSIDLFLGTYLRENRKGKTSHDNFPGVVLHTQMAHENDGDCLGFHLGWSGNHSTRVELLPEQRTYVQMAELLGTNEINLAAQETYTSPTLYIGYSAQGFSSLSSQFHEYIREHILSERIKSTPRPIHYNTWEGIYFDHDVDTLKDLASKVAKLGAERFVLDDGWFKGRRGDNAGLGDWVVDKAIYPQGLAPLIEHVNALGLEFGIWFEPEMVNPDSDLYRNHPEWVLSCHEHPQIAFRNQYVLDVANPDVYAYLYRQIDDVLTEYPQITYIKWDMNRDINHTGNGVGRSNIHAQTKAVYRLIEELKIAHKHLDIESCSSGGARIDLGILQFTDRVWTSDSNDALDRLSIQRGCSFFFPAEIMGSHVGPRDCHITGRHIPIETRAGVALFGSFGMEMDPRELTDDEQVVLCQASELYKKERGLIHSGKLYRSNQNGTDIDFGIVSKDQKEGIFAHNSIIESRRTMPHKYKFIGLDPATQYCLKRVWPVLLQEYSPSILDVIEGKVFSGEALMQHGMQLPITFPQTSLIFKVEAI